MSVVCTYGWMCKLDREAAMGPDSPDIPTLWVTPESETFVAYQPCNLSPFQLYTTCV